MSNDKNDQQDKKCTYMYVHTFVSLISEIVSRLIFEVTALKSIIVIAKPDK